MIRVWYAENVEPSSFFPKANKNFIRSGDCSTSPAAAQIVVPHADAPGMKKVVRV